MPTLIAMECPPDSGLPKILFEKALHSERVGHSKVSVASFDTISATPFGRPGGAVPSRDADFRDLRGGVVLALSGGPDSAALLDLWLTLAPDPGRALAAHLDHGIRPSSADDAGVAAEQARRAGLRFVSRRIAVPSLLRPGAGGLEAVARRARYRFLEEVALSAGFPAVATGHHLDDQAETVLLRLLRGSGLRGLAATAAARPIRTGSAVILRRPLLACRRADLLARVRARGWPFATDHSNTDGSNLRSVVRMLLLPALDSSRTGLVPRLAALAAAAAGRAGAWDRAPATPPPPAVREPRGDPEVAIDCPGRATLPDGTVLRCVVAAGDRRGQEPHLAVLDADRAPPPFRLRFARAGDRFCPLGLGAETTVFRFLMARGVPAAKRGRTPVVTSGDRVVWVVGYRIDERAAIGAATRDRVAFEVEALSRPCGADPRPPSPRRS
jgi:tRNA(Ile)-lysidine synthetase-like protein